MARVRIFITAEKSADGEGHIDYTPPYKDKVKSFPSTVAICVGGRFSCKASELLKAAKIVEGLDKLDLREEKS